MHSRLWNTHTPLKSVHQLFWINEAKIYPLHVAYKEKGIFSNVFVCFRVYKWESWWRFQEFLLIRKCAPPLCWRFVLFGKWLTIMDGALKKKDIIFWWYKHLHIIFKICKIQIRFSDLCTCIHQVWHRALKKNLDNLVSLENETVVFSCNWVKYLQTLLLWMEIYEGPDGT